MASLTYVGKVEQTKTCYLISFPDIPETLTFVNLDDLAKAPSVGGDCLITALRSRYRDNEDIPFPIFDGKGRGSTRRIIITVDKAMLTVMLSLNGG